MRAKYDRKPPGHIHYTRKNGGTQFNRTDPDWVLAIRYFQLEAPSENTLVACSLVQGPSRQEKHCRECGDGSGSVWLNGKARCAVLTEGVDMASARCSSSAVKCRV